MFWRASSSLFVSNIQKSPNLKQTTASTYNLICVIVNLQSKFLILAVLGMRSESGPVFWLRWGL
jgi:hypothetical protein